MPDHFRDANTGASQDFTDLAAVVQLRLRVAVVFWVANFYIEVPALNRRERGAIPWRPAIFPGRIAAAAVRRSVQGGKSDTEK